MAASINSPSILGCTLDYQTECTFALEPSVVGFIDKAELAGWDRRHAVIAVLSIVSMMLDDEAPASARGRHS